MSTNEFEPTPYKEISPVVRYFSDLHWKGDSFIDMRLSLERLIEVSGINMDGREIDSHVRRLLPNYDDTDSNPLEMKNAFTVLPLEVVAPYVDAMYNLRDLDKWYEQMLPYIKHLAEPQHDSECLSSTSFAFSNSCDYSSICPVVYTAKYLEADLFEREFSSHIYENDPIMAFEVAQRKEVLAVAHGFRTPAQANRMLEAYQDAFSERFSNHAD